MQYLKEELDTLKSKESTSQLQQKGREVMLMHKFHFAEEFDWSQRRIYYPS